MPYKKNGNPFLLLIDNPLTTAIYLFINMGIIMETLYQAPTNKETTALAYFVGFLTITTYIKSLNQEPSLDNQLNQLGSTSSYQSLFTPIKNSLKAFLIGGALLLLPIFLFRNQAVSQPIPEPRATIFVATVLVAPIFEELIFRKYLYKEFLSPLFGKWTALTLASLVFIFYHFPKEPWQVFYLTLSTIGLHATYELSDNDTRPVVVLHIINNLLAFI